MTRSRLLPSTWPMIIKAPLVVALLMSLMSMGVSYMIYDRMTRSQQGALEKMAETYMDGVSAALMPHVIRRDSWEVFDTLDRAQEHYASVKSIYTVVALTDGEILASSNPERFPLASQLPVALRAPFVNGQHLHINAGEGVAWVWRPLVEADQPVGDLFAELDISHLLQERQRVLVTLFSGAFLLTVVFVLIGYLAVHRMLHPLDLLSRYVESIRHGRNEPLPPGMLNEKTEFGTLFRRFDAMKIAILERADLAAKLAEEEKLALIGKLASSMAHEVNNPLGGMRNAIDTIRKHGDEETVRTRSLDLLERGLEGIANVTRATLVTYKGGSTPERLTFRDMEDLQFLVQHILKRKNLNLRWTNTLPQDIHVDGGSVRQIALNLLLNACEASPDGAEVFFQAYYSDGRIHVVVEDQGSGIPENVKDQLLNPSISGVPEISSGLGAWTVGMLTKRLNGTISVETKPEDGTIVTVRFPSLGG